MNTIRDFLAWAACLILSLLAVNAAIPQLQMFLYSGRVSISGGILIPLLFFLLVCIIFLSLRDMTGTQIRGLIFGFIITGLSGVSILYITLTNNMLSAGVRMFSTFFIPVLILLIIAHLEIWVNQKALKLYILVISIIIIGFGLWQANVNPYVLPARSTDGNFEVASYKFYSEIRAFSFFSSPYEYGIFLVFVAISCLQAVINRGIIYIPGLIIAIIAIYFTYTRNVYISAATAIMIMILYYFSNYMKPKLAIVFRTIIYFSIFLVSFLIPRIIWSASSSLGDIDIYQSSTLDIRLLSRDYWVDKIVNEGVLNIIFGLGYFQDNERTRNYVFVGEVIDNQLLSVLAGLGLLGVLCWLSLVSLIWWRINRLSQEAAYRDGKLSLISITMFSVWPVIGQFNIVSSSLFMLTAIAIMGISKPKGNFKNREKILWD